MNGFTVVRQLVVRSDPYTEWCLDEITPKISKTFNRSQTNMGRSKNHLVE